MINGTILIRNKEDYESAKTQLNGLEILRGVRPNNKLIYIDHFIQQLSNAINAYSDVHKNE